MVSCVGQPPVEGTSQILLRPLILETKAICLPSGDHVVPPILRVHVELLDGEILHVSYVLALELGGIGNGNRGRKCWLSK